MTEIEELRQVLHSNLELVRLLSQRIEILEKPRQEESGRMLAIMIVVRSLIQCSPNRDQIATMAERLFGQMQAQPGYILHGEHTKDMRRELQNQLDWLLTPPNPM